MSDPVHDARVRLAKQLAELLPKYGHKTRTMQAVLAGMTVSNWDAVLRGERMLPRAAWENLLKGAIGPILNPTTPQEIELRKKQQVTYDLYEMTVRKQGRPTGTCPKRIPHRALPMVDDALATLRDANSQDPAERAWLLSELKTQLENIRACLPLYETKKA